MLASSARWVSIAARGRPRGAAGVEQRGELLGVLQRRRRAAPAAETRSAYVVSPRQRVLADDHDLRVAGALEQLGLELAALDGVPASAARSCATASRTGPLVAASAMTSREPESEIIRGSSLARGARVDRHGDDLGPQHAEVAGHELEPVAEHDHHPVPGHHAQRAETGPRRGRPRRRAGPRSGCDRRPRPGPAVGGLGGGVGHEGGNVGLARHGRYFHNRGVGVSRAGLNRVTPPEKPRRRAAAPHGPAQRSALAGEAAAASAEVEAALEHPGRPRPRRVLRRRQHRHAGRQHLPPGARACTAASSSPPATSLGAAWKQAYFRMVGVEDPEHVAEARASALSFIAGHTVSELEELGEEIFDEAMAHRIWPGTRALAQMHLDQGQRVWLVTAAPIEIASIIARRLGLTGAMGTVAEHVDGVYTGRLVGDLLHGPAKAEAIKALAAREGLDLDRCSAYSDSFNDLPMLSLVGDPCAINPDARLRAHARQQGWRVRDYRTGRKAARVGVLVAAPSAGAVARRGGRRRSPCAADTTESGRRVQAGPSQRVPDS